MTSGGNNFDDFPDSLVNCPNLTWRFLVRYKRIDF